MISRWRPLCWDAVPRPVSDDRRSICDPVDLRPAVRARNKDRGHLGKRYLRWLTCWFALGLLLCAPASAQRAGSDVRVSDRIELAAGASGQITIAIAVDRGLTVSKDAAVIIDLAPEPGVAVKKKRLGRGDAVDPEADAPRFAINVRADAPGEHVIRVRVRFWLCGTRSCQPVDVRRAATVAVTDDH